MKRSHDTLVRCTSPPALQAQFLLYASCLSPGHEIDSYVTNALSATHYQPIIQQGTTTQLTPMVLPPRRLLRPLKHSRRRCDIEIRRHPRALRVRQFTHRIRFVVRTEIGHHDRDFRNPPGQRGRSAGLCEWARVEWLPIRSIACVSQPEAGAATIPAHFTSEVEDFLTRRSGKERGVELGLPGGCGVAAAGAAERLIELIVLAEADVSNDMYAQGSGKRKSEW